MIKRTIKTIILFLFTLPLLAQEDKSPVTIGITSGYEFKMDRSIIGLSVMEKYNEDNLSLGVMYMIPVGENNGSNMLMIEGQYYIGRVSIGGGVMASGTKIRNTKPYVSSSIKLTKYYPIKAKVMYSNMGFTLALNYPLIKL